MTPHPTLTHIPADTLPWQWWHPSATQGDLDHAGPRYLRRAPTGTYVAGFADEATARAYGRANGWTTRDGA